MYFRVLVDEKETPTEPDRACIQYIYSWVQQKMPFTVWNWFLPLTALMIFGIFFNTEHFAPSYDPSSSLFLRILASGSPFQSDLYPDFVFSVCIGITIAAGMNVLLSFFSKGILPQRSLIACGLGIIFGFPLLIEIINPSTSLFTRVVILLPRSDPFYLDMRIGIVLVLIVFIIVTLSALVKIALTLRSKEPLARKSLAAFLIGGVGACLMVILLIASQNTSNPPILAFPKTDPLYFDVHLGFVTFFTGSCVILSVLLIKVQGSEKPVLSWIDRKFKFIQSKIGVHSMDYAPIFVYLEKKSPQDEWKFVNSRWDHVHYCCKHHTDQSKIQEFDTSRQHFLVKNAWHSFQPKTPIWRYYKWGWSLCFFLAIAVSCGIVLWWVLLLFFQVDFLFGLEAALLIQIVSSLIMIGLWILVINLKHTELDLELQNLELTSPEVQYNHLTPKKLQVLWNLPGEAVFLIQTRLQNPFPFPSGKTSSTAMKEFRSFYDKDHEKEKFCKASRNWLLYPILAFAFFGISALMFILLM